MSSRILLTASFASLLLVGAGCLGGSGGTAAPQPVTLEYWRAEENAAALDPVIAAYRKLHPHVTINAQTLRGEDYERELLEALAEDRGPDIFSVTVTGLNAWKSKILPVAKELNVATQVVDENKNIVTVNRKTPGMSLIELRNTFVEGAARDVVLKTVETEGSQPVDRIYGLPLSYDTLGLFYNKDLLRKAGYEKPPESWLDLRDMTAKMTVKGQGDAIVTSGAALGGAANVRHATDILAALMAQNGAQLADQYDGYATFHVHTDASRGKTSTPGVEALLFYQSFANPGSSAYAWNESMPDSYDAFTTGRAAFYFGYPVDAKRIKESAPRLDFGIAPIPQLDPSRPGNIANYPIEVVSRKTKHPNEAWDFVQFATSQGAASVWLEDVKRPTALRAHIAAQLTDPEIAPFAGQILTGRSWYRGEDWTRVEEAFGELILYRPSGTRFDYQTALNMTADIVNSTY